MKIALGLLVLALAGWLLAVLCGPREATAEALGFTSSAQCRDCHSEVYAEWKQSWHALSWTDPDVRAPSQSDNFANKDCIDCHAPKDVFLTGLGVRVLPRSTRRSEGVDCLACHRLPGGGMAGTLTNDRAACRPVATPDLQRADFCGVCHNQHKTVDQWRETGWAERGEGCIFCHMPFRDGDPNRGRSHRMLGGHDLPLLQSAVSLSAQRDGDTVVVVVENHGAGHAYPTDERSRASDLWWRPVGEEDWRHLHRIRDPYRYETDIPNTLLMPGEKRRIELVDADASGALEVLLVYKLTPYYRDPQTGEAQFTAAVTDPLSDSREVHRVRVEAAQ